MGTSNSGAKEFEGQVAGHGSSILILPNDTLLKRSCSAEIEFYRIAEEKNIPLKKFMPKCYNFDPSFEVIKEKYIPANDTTLYINMENLLLPFKHPTIMDLKLGTRLYDDHANEEKKQRMIKNAASTTSLKTGLKICGLHITDKSTKSVLKFDKKYGRALKEGNLAHGILRFLLNFTGDTYRGVTNDQFEEDMDQSVFNVRPSEYTLGFLQEVLHQTYQLKEAVMKSHVRIYGGSLCLIYETIDVEEEMKKYEQANSSSKDKTYHYPFSYHFIDFAHASFVDPELGEDPSLMTGIHRLISILEKYHHEKGEIKMKL